MFAFLICILDYSIFAVKSIAFLKLKLKKLKSHFFLYLYSEEFPVKIELRDLRDDVQLLTITADVFITRKHFLHFVTSI